jgi:hypothetical protein
MNRVRRARDGETRLAGWIVARAKGELRLYREYKARMEVIFEQTIRLPQAGNDGTRVQGGKTADPTYSSVSILDSNPEYRFLRGEVSRIEKFVSLLTDEQYRFVDLKYFNECTRDKIIDSLYISKRRYYVLDEQVLQKYAILSGMWRPNLLKSGTKWRQNDVESVV